MLTISEVMKMKEQKDVDGLLGSLQDHDIAVRAEAASSLGQLGNLKAVVPLISILQNDGNPYVRSLAAKALGELGDPRAMEPLQSAIMNDSMEVSLEAGKAGSVLAGKMATGTGAILHKPVSKFTESNEKGPVYEVAYKLHCEYCGKEYTVENTRQKPFLKHELKKIKNNAGKGKYEIPKSGKCPHCGFTPTFMINKSRNILLVMFLIILLFANMLILFIPGNPPPTSVIITLSLTCYIPILAMMVFLILRLIPNRKLMKALRNKGRKLSPPTKPQVFFGATEISDSKLIDRTEEVAFTQLGRKEVNTGVCDICNAPAIGTKISAGQMRDVVFKRGFNPFQLNLLKSYARLSGVGDKKAYEDWRNVVAQDTSDWNICANCMFMLRPYLIEPPHEIKNDKKSISQLDKEQLCPSCGKPVTHVAIDAFGKNMNGVRCKGCNQVYCLGCYNPAKQLLTCEKCGHKEFSFLVDGK